MSTLAPIGLAVVVTPVLPPELSVAPGSVWTPADAVFDESGNLRSDALDPSTLELLNKSRRDPGSHCFAQGPVFLCRAWSTPRTLDGAVQSADLTLLLRLTERTYGFLGGVAGQLFHGTAEALNAGDKWAVEDFFFFYPVGRFAAGPITVCKTDERFAPPPDVGGRVLFIQQGKRPSDASTFLGITDPADILYVNDDDEVVLSPFYRRASSAPAVTLESVRANALLAQQR